LRSSRRTFPCAKCRARSAVRDSARRSCCSRSSCHAVALRRRIEPVLLSGRPAFAVAGLNPHDRRIRQNRRRRIEVIAPAVEELNSSLVTDHPSLVFHRSGFLPTPFFHRAIEDEFDAVLCMYHDQGLIPLKLHAFHSGVNVTLGLPFPSHQSRPMALHLKLRAKASRVPTA